MFVSFFPVVMHH